MSNNNQYNTYIADNRIIGLDYLKVIAIFAVVWIHGSDTNKMAKFLQTYCAFSVPCFIIISAFLTQGSCSTKTDCGYVDLLFRRVKRLVPAYLAWTALYLIFRFIKRGLISDMPIDFDLIAIIFCGGASYQLWFVPALLIWTAVFAPLILFTTKRNNGNTLTASLFVLAGILLWAGMKAWPFLDIPSGYEMFGYMKAQSGYFILGIGLWSLFRQGSVYSRNQLTVMSIGIGSLLFALILLNLRTEYFNNFFTPLYSLSLFLSFFFILLRARLPFLNVISKYLAPCSFGIFLCHGIFIEGFQVFLNIAGIDNTPFVTTVGVILTSFICSAVLCIALRNHKVTRWLVI